MYKFFFKQVFDYLLSLLLIVILSPLMLSIYVFLLLKIGSPLFRQQRPGLNNKIFTIYKFKTILDKNCVPASRKKKVFSFGSFLRKTGMDELPQLINILKGECSFVGPRPLLKRYLKINKFKNHVRAKCKPGITGLAQIEINTYKKKNYSKWSQQFLLDEYYCKNISLLLDLKITLKTIVKIIKLSKNDYHEETFLNNSDLK